VKRAKKAVPAVYMFEHNRTVIGFFSTLRGADIVYSSHNEWCFMTKLRARITVCQFNKNGVPEDHLGALDHFHHQEPDDGRNWGIRRDEMEREGQGSNTTSLPDELYLALYSGFFVDIYRSVKDAEKAYRKTDANTVIITIPVDQRIHRMTPGGSIVNYLAVCERKEYVKSSGRKGQWTERFLPIA